MTKNVLTDTNYRHLDVDAYDADGYVEGEEAETPGLGPDENQVRQLLSANKNADALKAALLNPPLKTKNQASKEKAVLTVIKAMTSIKTSEIEQIITSLNPAQVDLLMMYIYKGMDISSDNQTCAQLLAWHSQAYASCGQGGIVRVFCSRNHL